MQTLLKSRKSIIQRINKLSIEEAKYMLDLTAVMTLLSPYEIQQRLTIHIDKLENSKA